MKWFKKLWDWLFRSHLKLTVFSFLFSSVVIGIVVVSTFQWTMHATSTESFCISCHEMEQTPYALLQKTAHFSNASGLSASCSDCHLPQPFLPKMARKIEASREVWHHFVTGKIDTPEKYAEHTPEMRAREVARIRANDSAECRNCHSAERWNLSAQSEKAREYHNLPSEKNKTCIDCHQGVGHFRPDDESAAAEAGSMPVGHPLPAAETAKPNIE